MKRATRILLLSAAAVTLAGCGGKRLASAPAWLRLDGTWQLNQRESANPAAVGGDQRGEPPRGGPSGIPGGGMPGGGGRPGGGRMPGGRSGGGPTGAGPGRAMPMTPPLERFTIEQSDTAVFFRFAPKAGVSVPTSWRKSTTRFWPGEEVVELRAKWSEDGLVLERGVAEGGSSVEVFSRAPESRRLVVTTKLPGGRTIRRVYDLVSPDS